MKPLHIVVAVLVFAIVLIAGFFVIAELQQRKIRKSLPRQIGTVTFCHPTKLPFLVQYQVDVLTKGRPSTHLTQPCLKKKHQYRMGAKIPVVLQPVKHKGQTMRIAYICQRKAHA